MRIRSFTLSLRVVCLGLILLLTSACGTANRAPVIDPTQAVKLLAGEYTTTITQEDVAKLDSLDPNITSNIGVWKITIKNNGTATAVLNDNKASIDLTYAIDGGKIEIGIRNGICSANVGRYLWGLVDKELYFTKMGDTCAGEVLILTSHPLVRTSK